MRQRSVAAAEYKFWIECSFTQSERQTARESNFSAGETRQTTPNECRIRVNYYKNISIHKLTRRNGAKWKTENKLRTRRVVVKFIYVQLHRNRFRLKWSGISAPKKFTSKHACTESSDWCRRGKAAAPKSIFFALCGTEPEWIMGELVSLQRAHNKRFIVLAVLRARTFSHVRPQPAPGAAHCLLSVQSRYTSI